MTDHYIKHSKIMGNLRPRLLLNTCGYTALTIHKGKCNWSGQELQGGYVREDE